MVMTHTNATRYECEKRFQPSFSLEPRKTLTAIAAMPTAAAFTNNDCPTSARRMLSPAAPPLLTLLPFAISVRVLCGSLEARARIRRQVVDAAASATLQSAHVHDDRPAILGFDLGAVGRHGADAVG